MPDSTRARLTCAERDRLWGEYNAALKVYIAAVNNAMPYVDAEQSAYLADTKARLDSCRVEIWQHCREHGCDPEYVNRFA